MSRKPRLHVLLVVSKLEGGIGRVPLNLSMVMAEQCEVTLCELWHGSTWGWRKLAEENGVRVINLRRRSRYDALTPLRLAKVLRQLRPDVVNGFDKTSNAMVVLASWLSRGLATVVCSVLGMVSGFTGWWNHVQRMTFQLADGVVACSDALAVKCLQQAPFIEGRLVRIHNAIPVNEFRMKYALPETKPRDVFYLGVVNALYSPIKGLEYAIRALSIVRKGRLDARLKVFGEGPLRPSIEQLADELGIGDAVEFVGHVADMEAHLEHLDVLLIPSLSEGLPLALLEAAAVGLPAIASAVGGVPEVVKDEVTGLLVPSGDIQALASAIRRLASDPVLVLEMGRNARQRVEQSFDVWKTTKEYLCFYDELIARKFGVGKKDTPISI